MSKKYIIERKMNISFDSPLSYQDFIDMGLHKKFDFSSLTTTISKHDKTKLDREFLIDYDAYKELFDVKYKKKDEYSIYYGIKDYTTHLLVSKFFGFGLSIYMLRRVFFLLGFDMKEIFESKTEYGIAILDSLEKRSDDIITGGWLDVIRYKDLQYKDKKGLEDNYNLMKEATDNETFEALHETITYRRELKKNYVIEYLIFCILIFDLHIYLGLGRDGQLYLFRKKDIYTTLESRPLTIVGISSIIKHTYSSIISPSLAKEIRDSYRLKKDISIEELLSEVQDQFNAIGNIDIIAESQEKDLTKRKDLEESFLSSNVGVQNYKGKKQHLTIKNHFKLKGKK